MQKEGCCNPKQELKRDRGNGIDHSQVKTLPELFILENIPVIVKGNPVPLLEQGMFVKESQPKVISYGENDQKGNEQKGG
jgi:hypothetical protein